MRSLRWVSPSAVYCVVSMVVILEPLSALVYDEVGVRSELVECCAFFGGDIVLGGEGCVCVLLQSR